MESDVYGMSRLWIGWKFCWVYYNKLEAHVVIMLGIFSLSALLYWSDRHSNSLYHIGYIVIAERFFYIKCCQDSGIVDTGTNNGFNFAIFASTDGNQLFFFAKQNFDPKPEPLINSRKITLDIWILDEFMVVYWNYFSFILLNDVVNRWSSLINVVCTKTIHHS